MSDKDYLRKLVICLAFVVAIGQTARAAAFTVPLAGDAAGLITGAAESIRKLLRIVLAVSALASLVFAAYHMTKGEKDAANKMILLVIGFSIGTAFLSGLKIKTASGGGGEYFSGTFGLVKSVLSAALSVVMMFSLVPNIIKVMQGDSQSLRKVITWAVVGSFGIGLLSSFRG